MTQITRPNFHRFHNGSKAVLPFCNAEYEARLAGLRSILRDKGVNAAGFYIYAQYRLLLWLSILRLWPSLWAGCHRN